MSEFEAEERAAATIFFDSWEFNGRLHGRCRFNHLPLLRLRPGVENEVAKIRELEVKHSRATVVVDTLVLLRDGNWRSHLVACIAALDGARTAELIDAFWATMRRFSWGSPQLVATASLIDPDFVPRALLTLTETESDDKLIDALSTLLEQRCGVTLSIELSEKVRKSAEQRHPNNAGGGIALQWAERATALFGL